MAIKSLTINGFRGYSERTEIDFSIPNGNPGSGLNIMVGPNNSGKSSIIEIISILFSNNNYISKDARYNGGTVYFKLEEDNGNIYELKTINKSEIKRTLNNDSLETVENNNYYILNSKRKINNSFNSGMNLDRRYYHGNIPDGRYREDGQINNEFGQRLKKITSNSEAFNECMSKVINPIPEWGIETEENGNSYLEFEFDGVKHSSKGSGDGYINIFNIIDSLYDSTSNNVVIIDEPEIALHPDLQRKLFSLLVEYSKNIQIIISTHSPFFVDWETLCKEGKLLRFIKKNNKIQCFELSQDSKDNIIKLLDDSHNIHTISLDANETFFLSDNIILTEGQDDVYCYKKLFKKEHFIPNASFFGWGAGGADKIKIFLQVFDELGYSKVFTIVDNDKKNLLPEFRKNYPSYEFYSIKAKDVHNKSDDRIDKLINKANKEITSEDEKKLIVDFLKAHKNAVLGLLSSEKECTINEEYKDDVGNLIFKIKNYFKKNVSLKERKISNTNNSIDNESKVNAIANEYINNFKKKLLQKTSFIECGGFGTDFRVKEVKKNIYSLFEIITIGVGDNYNITIGFKLIIDIQNAKIKKKRKYVIENKLPIEKLSKIILNLKVKIM